MQPQTEAGKSPSVGKSPDLKVCIHDVQKCVMYRTGPLILMLSWLSPPLHRMSGSWEKTQNDLALASRAFSSHTPNSS